MATLFYRITPLGVDSSRSHTCFISSHMSRVLYSCVALLTACPTASACQPIFFICRFSLSFHLNPRSSAVIDCTPMLAAGYQLGEEMREPVSARDFVEICSTAPDHSPHCRPDFGMVSCVKPCSLLGCFSMCKLCCQLLTTCSTFPGVSAGFSNLICVFCLCICMLVPCCTKLTSPFILPSGSCSS